MKPLFLLLALIGQQAVAQTYFYINSIDVIPSSPTTSDQIEIQINGDLSSTAAFIQDVQYTIVGNTVNFMISANTSGIGLDILVPHTESIVIGLLPVGTYSINIAGAGILDSAPLADHEFIVSEGSGACEGLQIVSIMYEAFSDSLIEVHVVNSGSGIYSYPGFILYDAEGDTIAIENVAFFGIAGTSIHHLTIHPDANLIVPFFTGTLQLWTNFYDSLNCTFPVEVELCPPPCATIVPYVTNMGGAITNNIFSYMIANADGPVISGILELSDEGQFDADTICIPPGEYSMQVTASSGPGGGQPWAGVLTPGHVSGPQQPVASPPVQIEFTFYEHCIEIIDQVGDTGNEEIFRFSRTADLIIIDKLDQSSIGSVVLMDAKGAILRSQNASRSQVQIAIGDLSAGVYMLKLSGEDGATHHHGFVITR